MSLLIIPHSGTYYGRFEFAVVTNGKQQMKLKVTVRDKRNNEIIYSTKDTWVSGNKLALPPGEYSVHAELLMPRLGGCTITVNTSEMNYLIFPENARECFLSKWNTLSHLSRDEIMSSGSRVEELGPLQTYAKAPSVASTDRLNKREMPVPFGVCSSLRRSASESSQRSFLDAGAENNVEARRGFSCSLTNLEKRRESLLGQTHRAFSEQLSRHVTPLSVDGALCAGGVTRPDLPPSFKQWDEQHPKLSGYSVEGGNKVNTLLDEEDVSYGAGNKHKEPCIWDLSPTVEKRGKNGGMRRLSGRSNVCNRSAEQMKTRGSPINPLPQRLCSEELAQFSSKRASGLFSEVTLPQNRRATGHSPVATMTVSQNDLRRGADSPPILCGSGAFVDQHSKTPVPHQNINLGELPPNPAFAETEASRFFLNECSGSKQECRLGMDCVDKIGCLAHKQSGHQVFLAASDMDENTASSNRKLMNRSGTHTMKLSMSSCKDSSTFLIPPPEVIDLHSPFSLALTFGSLNTRPVSSSAYLNIMLEEDLVPGNKPVEPVVCVVPATVAALPIVAKGINGLWICSPLIHANEKTGVIEFFSCVEGGLRNGIAISTVCFGPSWDGLALSGIQFFLGNVTNQRPCQFFLFFREIEDMSIDDNDSKGIMGYSSNTVRTDNVIATEKSARITTLDESALNAEIIYNSLPYIRCIATEDGEMLLEVHHKNVIVACVPVREGSRISFYFGTATQRKTVSSEDGGAAGDCGESQSYLCVLLNYRTLFCHPIHSEHLPGGLRAIIMSNVVLAANKGDAGCEGNNMRLCDVQLLSHQRRFVAFADDVSFDGAQANRLNSSLRSASAEQEKGGAGRQMTMSVWVAGDKRSVGVQQCVTLLEMSEK